MAEELLNKFKKAVAKGKAKRASKAPSTSPVLDSNGLTAKLRWKNATSLDREGRKLRRNGVKKKGLSPPSSRGHR